MSVWMEDGRMRVKISTACNSAVNKWAIAVWTWWWEKGYKLANKKWRIA